MLKQLAIAALSLAALPSLAMAQDAAAGEKLFQSRCATCHAFDAAKKPGPGLAHVVGAKAGANDAAFKYSKGLTNAGLTWDEATFGQIFDGAVEAGTGYQHGDQRSQSDERASILAFLKTK